MQKLYDWWNRAPTWQAFALIVIAAVILLVLLS